MARPTTAILRLGLPRWRAARTGLGFHCHIKPECYMTCGDISIIAAAVREHLAAHAISAPQAGRPLLQSRGCEREIAAWRVSVEILAKRFHVSGAVQGVGFRFFAENVAARLGVAGYVKNLFDGRVEVYAIGNAAQLGALKNELLRGPRMAVVDRVTESETGIVAEYSKGFTIERDD